MNEGIGNLSFPPPNEGEGMQTFKPYSETMAVKIDEEAMAMVRKAYDRTLQLVTEKKDLIHTLANELLEKETIGHDDIVKVLGARPFKTDAYKQYLANTAEFQEKHPDQMQPTGSINKTKEEKAAEEANPIPQDKESS